MNTAIGLAFLVIIVVLEEATGIPEQQLDLEYQGEDNDEEYLERKGDSCGTKSACKFSGGWCKPLTEECEGKWRTARFYCKNSKKCGCCIPAGPPGCVFGGKSYPDKTLNRETCVDLLCNKGVWESQGNIAGDCGTCEVYGDPHIIPYEPHNMTNPPPTGNPVTKYNDYNTGQFVISQPYPESEVFGVDAEFEDCIATDGSIKSCVGKAFYNEPGVTVQLVLPEKFLENCYKQPEHYSEPGCHITQILVNNVNRTIVNGEPATSFYGTDGTVLIFTESCGGWCNYIYIVGSKGYTVRLMVDPSNDKLYSLHIYATPSLQNKIFGLCDVFTGKPVDDGFTSRDGTMITNYDNLHNFTTSWKGCCPGDCCNCKNIKCIVRFKPPAIGFFNGACYTPLTAPPGTMKNISDDCTKQGPDCFCYI